MNRFSRQTLIFGAALSVSICAAVAQQTYDVAPAFTLEDQVEKSHTFTFPRGKPLVLFVSDSGGADDAPAWRDAILKKYGDEIQFQGIVNLVTVPTLMRGAARLAMRALRKNPVLCDWDGKVSESLKAKQNQANIIVISISGKILHRASHAANEEKLGKVYAAIDAAFERPPDRGEPGDVPSGEPGQDDGGGNDGLVEGLAGTARELRYPGGDCTSDIWI